MLVAMINVHCNDDENDPNALLQCVERLGVACTGIWVDSLLGVFWVFAVYRSLWSGGGVSDTVGIEVKGLPIPGMHGGELRNHQNHSSATQPLPNIQHIAANRQPLVDPYSP